MSTFNAIAPRPAPQSNSGPVAWCKANLFYDWKTSTGTLLIGLILLWLLPLMTWYQLISRLRNIAEHAMVGPADDPLRNTRTTIANPLMRLVLAPYWVNYHLEHHLFVFTPCWKLPRAHRLLRAAGLLERMEVETSYWRVLQKACSASSDSDTRGTRRKTVSHI
jgi:fatty acid desaturase